MTQSKRKARIAAKRKTENTIKIIAGSVVLLILAWLIWTLISSQQPVTNQSAASGAVEKKTYSEVPAMAIDASKKYKATFNLAKGGSFTVELYPDKAPVTVNSFVFLAREKYFDGTTFHRVLEGFMAQGGDPTGTGMGGPGYEIQNEDSDLKFNKPGVLAMANAGRDTNGSQFFITFVATPQLDGGYTIFGQVVEGMEVVNGITRRDPMTNPDFTGDVINSVTISEE